MVKDFSYPGLLSLANDFPTKVSKRRKSRLTKTEQSYYHNWGFFSFSGMQGITNITKRFPDACRFMNEWISKHARKGLTTSIAVNRDAKSLLRADSRNLKASDNFAVSFGDFQGGLLWIEGMGGQGPKTQTKANGTVVTGGSRNTKDSPLYFAPHLHHCVLPWTGTRFGLIAFTSSQVGSLSNEVREQLESLNFRLPATAAVAAPARHLPRSIACTAQGGLKFKQWWTIDSHNTPTHLLPLTHLITSVRDEGGACIITSQSMAIVVRASLSVGDFRSFEEIWWRSLSWPTCFRETSVCCCVGSSMMIYSVDLRHLLQDMKTHLWCAQGSRHHS